MTIEFDVLSAVLGVTVGSGFVGAVLLIRHRRTLAKFQNSLSEMTAAYDKSCREKAESDAHLNAERESKSEFRALLNMESERNAARLEARDALLDERAKQLEETSRALLAQSRALEADERNLELQSKSVTEELERVSKLSRDEAREEYLERIKEEFYDNAIEVANRVEKEAVQAIEAKAKKILIEVMQRSAVEYVTEANLAVVELPSEDMKGRIIGREGRNIRTFEQIAGVDLIIDETPEAVIISSFDPVRREIARLALMNLMVDGRIHPARIEELFEKSKGEVERMIVEAGEKAALRANVSGLTAPVIETLGKLRFRTSYAQNVLDHSVEVAVLAGHLASELGLNVELAKRAGLLHDIGKALGPEFEGPHAITGMNFLQSHDEKDALLNAVGAHHNDIEPSFPESVLVIIADQVSAARPGARRESLDNYIKRLTALETLATSFKGVERAFAIQAGREIRLIVKPEILDDLQAKRLANQVAKKIETDLEFPGQVKVTVIREFRHSQIAKK